MFAAQQFLTAKWVTMPASNSAGIVTPRDREGSHVIGGTAFRLLPPQQFRQLDKVHRHSPRLVADQQLSRRPPAGLVLEAEIAERLQGAVADNEATRRCARFHNFAFSCGLKYQ